MRATLAEGGARPHGPASACLETLGPEDELEQFNFGGPKSAGNVFFANNGQEFVGVVTVDRRSDGVPDP
jgi:hypothetical protein